jgi:GNAT superfamily N-acetyltransferase
MRWCLFVNVQWTRVEEAPMEASHHGEPSVLEGALRIRPFVAAWGNRFWYRREICYYTCDGKQIMDLPRPQMFRRNSYEDLRHYQACDPWQMPPEGYRLESYKRLRRGDHLYTLVLDGQLAFYGWLADRESRREEPLFGQVFFPPSDASVIFDCYTHPALRGRGLYYQALCQMLHDAREVARAEQVCIGTLADNQLSRRVIEKLPFRYIGSMIKKRRLFKLQRYAVATDSRFQTAFLQAPSQTQEHS